MQYAALRILRLAIVLAYVLGVASIARADMVPLAPQAKATSTLERSALLDAVVDTIDRRFVDPELLKTLNWRERADAIRASVLSAPSTEDAVARINDLI